ncbi:MAG: hypothetical protein NC548_22985 [Lachnospiraceae bacterium]|nr:hypothetical protein [Lachnospiraceae bacterium]
MTLRYSQAEKLFKEMIAFYNDHLGEGSFEGSARFFEEVTITAAIEEHWPNGRLIAEAVEASVREGLPITRLPYLAKYPTWQRGRTLGHSWRLEWRGATLFVTGPSFGWEMLPIPTLCKDQTDLNEAVDRLIEEWNETHDQPIDLGLERFSRLFGEWADQVEKELDLR